jgi:hypothetical protein
VEQGEEIAPEAIQVGLRHGESKARGGGGVEDIPAPLHHPTGSYRSERVLCRSNRSCRHHDLPGQRSELAPGG